MDVTHIYNNINFSTDLRFLQRHLANNLRENHSAAVEGERYI